MASQGATGSGVPLVRLRRVDDFVGRIEVLTADARAQGYDSLAYFLEMALTEARIQFDHEAGDRRMRKADPKDLWLPER